MAILQLNLCGLEHFPFEGCFTDCMGINESSYVKGLYTSELNVNKSSLDISNKMIKLASRALSIPFAYIFNQSIST